MLCCWASAKDAKEESEILLRILKATLDQNIHALWNPDSASSTKSLCGYASEIILKDKRKYSIRYNVPNNMGIDPTNIDCPKCLAELPSVKEKIQVKK